MPKKRPVPIVPPMAIICTCRAVSFRASLSAMMGRWSLIAYAGSEGESSRSLSRAWLITWASSGSEWGEAMMVIRQGTKFREGALKLRKHSNEEGEYEKWNKAEKINAK